MTDNTTEFEEIKCYFHEDKQIKVQIQMSKNYLIILKVAKYL